MADDSLYQQLRQLDFTVKRIAVSVANAEDRSSTGLRALDKLKRDIRISLDTLKDYELFQLDEDLRMQAQTLPKAVRSLEKTRDSLLGVSEYDLIGAVDVAHISAQLDELIDRLR